MDSDQVFDHRKFDGGALQGGTAHTDTPRTDAAFARAKELFGDDCALMLGYVKGHTDALEGELAAARTEADELARRCIQKALPVFASTFCTPDDLIARVRAEMEKEKGNG